MAQKIVKSRLKHNGGSYNPGDTIDTTATKMGADLVKQLEDAGVLADAPKAAQKPGTKARTSTKAKAED